MKNVWQFTFGHTKGSTYTATGNIFLKNNRVWSQSCNVKSYSATLKVHIASTADTLLRNSASKDNGRGRAFDKEVEENVFCVLFSSKLTFDTSLLFDDWMLSKCLKSISKIFQTTTAKTASSIIDIFFCNLWSNNDIVSISFCQPEIFPLNHIYTIINYCVL